MYIEPESLITNLFSDINMVLSPPLFDKGEKERY